MGMLMRRHYAEPSPIVVEEAVATPLPATEEVTGKVDEVVDENHQYTKSEIQKMTTAEVKALAEKVGIENAQETSGARLKDVLIKRLVK